MRINTLMLQRIYLLIIFLGLIGTSLSLLIYHTAHTTTWHVAASDDSVVNYAPELQGLERSRALGRDLWFRHIRNESVIAIPNSASPQIITLTVLLRSDKAPSALGIRTAHQTLWIYRDASMAPRAAHIRRVMWYGQPNERYIMQCDNTHITDPAIQPLCTAFIRAHGSRVGDARLSAFMWVFLPYVSWMILGIISAHKLTQRIWHRVWGISVWGGAGLHIWWLFSIQIESWRHEITLMCAITSAVIALIPQRRQTWLLVVFGLAMLIRIGGHMVPGSPGTDRIIHAQQLRNVMNGDLYQSNRGLIVINDLTKQQPQVYPYPPGAYLGVIPFVVVFDALAPPTLLIGIVAIVFEGVLTVILAQVLYRLRIPESAIRITAIIALCLPQAYVLHIYTTAAQSIGQTLAWIGVFWALTAQHKSQRRQIGQTILWGFLATASHIGVFITMSVVHGWMWVLQRGRFMASSIGWLIGSGLVWVIFYSQYIGLITQQVTTIRRIDTPYWRDELEAIWSRGINDHYSWIMVAMMILAWGTSTIQKHTALRLLYSASILMALTFIVLRVAIHINPTRFIIFVAPIVALGAGVFGAHMSRHRAGRALIQVLIGYLAYTSMVQWYTMMITHQMQRWYTPQ